MTNSCHICGLGSYVPPKILTNRDLEKLVDTSDEWIMSRTGIRLRHILDSGVIASDAARVAARAALTDAGVSAGELTHIFVATCSPDYFCPSTACLVAGRLGLSARSEGHGAHVMCMDFNAACSGFLYGLELARSALALRPDAVVLLIGAEALSRRIDFSDRSTCVLFGDGAGAVVLRGAGTGCLWRVRDSVCCADGSMHDLIVMGGGSAMEVKKGDALPDDFFLAMQGREDFRQAVPSMTAETLAKLERHRMQESDIDLFIAHQANLRIIEAVGSRLGIAEDKVFINVQDYANTSAATLPLALDDARSQGRLKRGMKVLLATFGGGITWGAALLG